MAKVTIDCETYLKLINGTASEGGTTSGGDYTSSDTSSGQSGSGGGSGKKTSGKNTGGKKNQTVVAPGLDCDEIFAYQQACRGRNVDWRWIVAMNYGNEKFKGARIANLYPVVQTFVENVIRYQRIKKKTETYSWQDSHGYAAMAHFMGSEKADKVLRLTRLKLQPTIGILIKAIRGELGPVIPSYDRVFNLGVTMQEGAKISRYVQYVLQLFNAISKKYKKDHYCVPTILKWGTWDWKDGTFK